MLRHLLHQDILDAYMHLFTPDTVLIPNWRIIIGTIIVLVAGIGVAMCGSDDSKVWSPKEEEERR